eukprot:435384-Alexandrium_andersonii.AAC.1
MMASPGRTRQGAQAAQGAVGRVVRNASVSPSSAKWSGWGDLGRIEGKRGYISAPLAGAECRGALDPDLTSPVLGRADRLRPSALPEGRSSSVGLARSPGTAKVARRRDRAE